MGSALLSAALLLPLAAALTFDCENAVAGGHKFDLSRLGGVYSVSNPVHSRPNVLNTTYSIDICNSLGRDKNIDRSEQCPEGTRVCSISTLQRPKSDAEIEHVFPIARQWTHDGAHLEPKLQILPDRDSNSDSEKEGLRVVLSGGKDDRNKLPQKAIIEFLCQSEDERRRRRDANAQSISIKNHTQSISITDTTTEPISVADHDDDDDEDDDDDDDTEPDPAWKAQKSTDDGHGGTLTFLSYVEDSVAGTLHLEWMTDYACLDYDGSLDPEDRPSKGGWGFFGWLFFLGFFGLGLYLAFFAWVNYSKYGASGWDLLPHSDTLRDLPYILGDWGRKVLGTVTGGPSRGGYSAV